MDKFFSSNDKGVSLNQPKPKKSRIILKIFLGFVGLVFIIYLFGIGVGETRSYATEDNKHKIYEKPVLCFPYPSEFGFVNLCSKTILFIDNKPYNLGSPTNSDIIISDDNRVAYTANTNYGMKNIVYIDKKASKDYEIVYYLFLTKDNKFQYLAVDGDYIKRDWVLMEENTELWRVKDAVPPKMKVSNDREKIAVVYKLGDKEVLSINGKEGESKNDEIVKDSIVFSDDGNHYGYIAHNKSPESYLAVVDDEDQKSYSGVFDLNFSPDSQHFAYKTIIEKDWQFIYDGNESETYDKICTYSGPFGCQGAANNFSPTGKYYFYTAKKGDSFLNVINGAKRSAFEEIKGLNFSKDDTHLSYIGKKDNINYLIYDDNIVAQHKYIVKSLFSNDGKHFAYEATDDGSNYFLVLDGVNVGNKGDNIPNSQFSDDGKNITYGDARRLVTEKVSEMEYMPKGNFEKDVFTGFIDKTTIQSSMNSFLESGEITTFYYDPANKTGVEDLNKSGNHQFNGVSFKVEGYENQQTVIIDQSTIFMQNGK